MISPLHLGQHACGVLLLKVLTQTSPSGFIPKFDLWLDQSTSEHVRQFLLGPPTFVVSGFSPAIDCGSCGRT